VKYQGQWPISLSKGPFSERDKCNLQDHIATAAYITDFSTNRNKHDFANHVYCGPNAGSGKTGEVEQRDVFPFFISPTFRRTRVSIGTIFENEEAEGGGFITAATQANMQCLS